MTWIMVSAKRALLHMLFSLVALVLVVMFLVFGISLPISQWCVIYPDETEDAPIYILFTTYERSLSRPKGSFSIRTVQWEKPTKAILDREESQRLLDEYVGNKDGELSNREIFVLLLLAGKSKSLKGVP